MVSYSYIRNDENTRSRKDPLITPRRANERSKDDQLVSYANAVGGGSGKKPKTLPSLFIVRT